jgi:hypothetical protein
MELYRSRVIPIAIRYRDLTTHPAPLRAILLHCGLNTDPIKLASSVMQQDSQEGSPLARDRARSVALTGSDRMRIRAIVAAVLGMHRRSRNRLICLPGTVAVDIREINDAQNRLL